MSKFLEKSTEKNSTPLGGGASNADNEEEQKNSKVPSGYKVPGSEDWNRMCSLINSKVLKMTPGHYLKGGASNEEYEENRDIECPICLGPKKDEVKTTCGHNFCRECIEMSLKLKSECPYCCTTISIKNLKPVITTAVSKMVSVAVTTVDSKMVSAAIEQKVGVGSVSSSGATSTICPKSISYDFDDGDLEYYSSDDDDHYTTSIIVGNIMANGGDFGDNY
jgi:hypothetical protein